MDQELHACVIPVKTGIQSFQTWTPASAGVTMTYLHGEGDVGIIPWSDPQ